MDSTDVFSLQAKITSQMSLIKKMKKDGAPISALNDENEILAELRSKLSELEKLAIPSQIFNRKSFDELILRKMYVVPSFEIHNGPAGLFDYGPPACALKMNILSLWRQYFVLEENMLEMECTNLTPSSVLETSGHVERFTDFMVRDEKTGECARADKVLEDSIDKYLEVFKGTLNKEEEEAHRVVQRQADGYSADELHELFQKYKIVSPSGNAFTRPYPFNLMFQTTIGPEGTSVGYLRPETAQGLFVNFRRLLDYNQAKMPFAAAQIGTGFRNEIAPRNGLLRVREFCMAEIEHFVNPDDKSHPKFRNIANVKLELFPQEQQLTTGRTVSISIGDAVKQGIVNNETLGYFMTRTFQWATAIGVLPDRVRFRQHLKTEMAHYASDCWDLEVRLSHGWTECAGHADRACYDLEQHSKRTGVQLTASARLPQPVVVDRRAIEVDKKQLGPLFKGDQKAVLETLLALDDEQITALELQLQANGSAVVGGFTLPASCVKFVDEKRTVSEVKYTPSVVEPSYGIGRLIYSVLEHSFSQRDGDEQRCVMSFPPVVAPVKVALLRLQTNAAFDPPVSQLQTALTAEGVSCRADSSSGSIGRRYARADELGVPLCVTVDFQSLADQSVTVRERDSMQQLRVPQRDLLPLLVAYSAGRLSWASLLRRYRLEGSDDQAATVLQATSRGSFSRPRPAESN